MAVIFLLHEAQWRLSFCYMRQDSDYLSAILGGMVVICQLHQAGEWLSARVC
jgi:hypothetical protein